MPFPTVFEQWSEWLYIKRLKEMRERYERGVPQLREVVLCRRKQMTRLWRIWNPKRKVRRGNDLLAALARIFTHRRRALAFT